MKQWKAQNIKSTIQKTQTDQLQKQSCFRREQNSNYIAYKLINTKCETSTSIWQQKIMQSVFILKSSKVTQYDSIGRTWSINRLLSESPHFVVSTSKFYSGQNLEKHYEREQRVEAFIAMVTLEVFSKNHYIEFKTPCIAWITAPQNCAVPYIFHGNSCKF